MNENIAFNGRKLKPSGLVHACFTMDGIVRIKKSESGKPPVLQWMALFALKNQRVVSP